MKSRRLFSTTALVVFLVSTAAHGHRVGMSRGQYDVGPAEVSATLTFAGGELAGMPGDASAAIAAKTLVSMGGAACHGELTSTAPVAPDGIALSLRYDCPRSGDVAFRYDFVDALEPGHRHIAEITGDGRTTTFVAYHGDVAFDVRHSPDRPLLEFFRLGMEHVLGGWDHLAFLLGVALAAWSSGASGSAAVTSAKDTRRRLRALALAVTAFTVAHSMTLAATVLGWVAASSACVEPLIALSIAFVGLQASFGRARAPARMTFVFGLVHGMGFAGALRAIAIPPPRLPAALALFNGGVEAGQLLALVPAVLVLTWPARRPALLPRAMRIAGATLAVLGCAVCASRGAAAVQMARAAAIDQTPQRASIVAPAVTAEDVNRLCRTIHELPRVRRAECEHMEPGVVLTASCTAKLAPAVASGAVTMSSEDVAACVTELAHRYDTCDFVGERAPPHARSCENVLHGARAAGATCRSSLECRPGLFCDGSGPLDAGVCHPPRGSGEACGLSIDPLAAYMERMTTEQHPECEGRCVSYRCRPAEIASTRP